MKDSLISQQAGGEEGRDTNTPIESLHSGERELVICVCLKGEKNVLLKYKKQWFLVYSSSCETITII